MLSRSCIVCSNKLNKQDLIRLVIIEEKLLFDISQKIPSRGYYVCNDLNCISKIDKRRKKIKSNFTFDMDENMERLKNNFITYILKMININYLNKNIVVGVKDSLFESKKLNYILTSSDISELSLNRIKRNIDENKIIDYINLNRLKLGKSVNRSEVVALGFKKIKDLNFKRVISQYKILFS